MWVLAILTLLVLILVYVLFLFLLEFSLPLTLIGVSFVAWGIALFVTTFRKGEWCYHRETGKRVQIVDVNRTTSYAIQEPGGQKVKWISESELRRM